MAKSKRSRATVHNDAGNGAVQIKTRCCTNNIELTQEAIDRHWGALPAQAKAFILGSPDGMFSLSKLVKFWSLPQIVESTRGGIAGSICGATWYLALVYLKLHMFKEARALTINGSFMHQCYNSSIEYIISISDPAYKSGGVITDNELPYFVRGRSSVRSPDAMKSYIETYLPKEYTQMMTSFANLASKKNVMGYIDQISDDWKGTSKNCHRSSSASNDGAQIKLILADDANEDDRQSFDIGSSTTLKALFNDYAEKRGISLRSLRFSFAGKMLFLSSAGHKTPEEFGMQDQDVIKVHDTSKHQESSDDDSHSSQTRCSTPLPIKKKTKAKRSKKAKGKNKKPRQQQDEYCTKTLEEYKVEHSKRLTKIHDEAQARFKQIRQRLNNLVIARSQRKIKSQCPRSPKPESSLPSLANNPFKEGLGGKAGKSHYVIQVGEVQNLYKTTKPSHSTSKPLSPLDLHGCTRDEALAKLDERLKAWVDTAMQGSYPFVQPAVIVCGCGNQILSETVQDWIRSNDKVSNAPKTRSSRRRMVGSRAA